MLQIWIQAAGHFVKALSEMQQHPEWNVSSKAKTGDLLILYRPKPESCIRDRFAISGPVHYGRAWWKPPWAAKKEAYIAPIERVCLLQNKISQHDVRDDSQLAEAPFVRANFQGHPYLATPYWPYLYRLIISKNADLADVLRYFRPDQLVHVEQLKTRNNT